MRNRAQVESGRLNELRTQRSQFPPGGKCQESSGSSKKIHNMEILNLKNAILRMKISVDELNLRVIGKCKIKDP